MTIEVTVETHATTEDNEAGIATGWLPGRLSAAGKAQAGELGHRRADGGYDAIFSSDLVRAVETVRIAFPGWEEPPGGESWREAIARVTRCIDDLRRDWHGSKLLVLGYTSTYWAFEHVATGSPVEERFAAPFEWQPGWDYVIR